MVRFFIFINELNIQIYFLFGITIEIVSEIVEMKRMKILSILVFIFGFLQCGSLKLEEKHPFKIQSAISTEWSGAQLGSRGMDVKIIYSSDKNIEFDSIYFSKRMVKIESYIIKGQKMIVGHFNISTLK